MLSLRLGFSDDSGAPEGGSPRIAYDLTAEGFGPGVNGPFYLAVELPEAGDQQAVTITDARLTLTRAWPLRLARRWPRTPRSRRSSCSPRRRRRTRRRPTYSSTCARTSSPPPRLIRAPRPTSVASRR